MTEEFYAIRRQDGEPIYGEFTWITCDNPLDWSQVEEIEHDEPTTYELVRMEVHPVVTRTFPTCSLCPLPATHWGLCEAHAREDDPGAFAAAEDNAERDQDSDWWDPFGEDADPLVNAPDPPG